MIILFIIGIAAFLTGVITATISLIRALTQEVKYLKQIRLHSCDSSQSIFLALADYDSLVRVLGDTFTYQRNLFFNVLRNKKVLRFMLLFLVQTNGYTVTVCEPDDLFFHIKHNCTDDTLDSRARIILLSEKINDGDSVSTIIQPFGIVSNIIESLTQTIIDMLDKDFKHEDAEDCQKLISMVLSCFVTFANDEFFGDNPSEKFEPDLY